MGPAVVAGHGPVFGLVGVADGHVEAGQPAIQLHLGGHRVRDEPEVLSETRRQRCRRKTEHHAVGQLGQHRAREGAEQVAVAGRRGSGGGDALYLVEELGSLGRVGCNHDVC